MRKRLLMMNILFAAVPLRAQVGIQTSNPDATLDIRYDSTKNGAQGILIPRMTGDQIQGMSMTPNQDGLQVFATTVPTSSNDLTSLITKSGLYYYLASANRWYNVNAYDNSVFSTSYSSSAIAINRYSGGSGATDYNNQSQASFTRFATVPATVETLFSASPFVQQRTTDAIQGIKFLKRGIYSVTVQFTYVINRDVTAANPINAALPDRPGSQITYQLIPNFLASPSASYISNIKHNSFVTPTKDGTGFNRLSGIAIGNIKVLQDNTVEFVPEIRTSGYYVSSEEIGNSTNGGVNGEMSIHVLRISDL